MTYKKSYKNKSNFSPTRPRSSRSSASKNTLITRNKNGYSQYYDKKTDSWKFTHRTVAEKKIGGRVRPGYEVHHINHNKKDNRPSNLIVLSKSEHRKIHAQGSKRTKSRRIK